MEVTVTVSMTRSEPAVYTVNVYEDAPCWRAEPVSFRELVQPEAKEVLQQLGVPEDQASALISSIPGTLIIVKLKLALPSEYMELLSCRTQLAAAQPRDSFRLHPYRHDLDPSSAAAHRSWASHWLG